MATIRKRGDKWQVQVRRNGAEPRSKTFSLRRDAERWALAQERDLDRLTVEGPQVRLPSGWAVRDLLLRYRDELLPAKKCGEFEAYLVGALIRSPLADRPLCALTPADIAAHRDARLASVQGSAVRRELGVLGHAFEIARREWGYTGLSNPVRLVRKPQADPARSRRLAPDEWERLLASLDACENRVVPNCARFAIETAMRMGELLALRWTEVDLARRTAAVVRSKNGHPRTVPLSRRAVDIVTGSVGLHSSLVFPTTASALKQAWRRAIRRADVDDLHFHDLRHEAISRFFERGLSLPEVALISGHRDPRMLFRYTHLRAEDVVAKLD